ncbi:unnamed protein product [Acanthoscelides obtectus]|uniref:Uncharacterized protein n=1 Tax=Acanthoscelides obtectus TaxID=200917 RepID=A0A9P0L3D0_ACAOB|nr:unnamed protein product [Acanthoscelides obtectus]CAK1677740.1 hypothetical protein AOBTE_LOCUS31526 [Acanthoscelides obtectus]
MHSINNCRTMVNTVSVVLLLLCAFYCVLVDPQSGGFTFSFETENGIKRAFVTGSANFHGVYIYNTKDGARHVVHFGGSERESGPFVTLSGPTTSRPVGPPVPYYPTVASATRVPAPAPVPGPAPAPAPTPTPAPAYGVYPVAPGYASYGGRFGETGGYGGGYGGGGTSTQSIAPGLVASAIGGGLG